MNTTETSVPEGYTLIPVDQPFNYSKEELERKEKFKGKFTPSWYKIPTTAIIVCS